MRQWLLTLLCGGLGSGCLSFPAFECSDSLQCDPGGVCEAQGHCSYEDVACDSGRRYGPHAGDLSNQCVPGDGDTTPGAGDGSGGGSSTSATSGGSTSGGDGDAGTTSTSGATTTACTGDGGGDTGTGCGRVGSLGATIDDGDPCFELHGPEEWWRYEGAGFGGSLVWTFTTDLADATNYVVWRLTFAEAGEYRVEVYVDPQYGFSKQAAYEVSHLGGTDTVVLDQSAASGWASLGDFEFDYLGGQWVRLHDNTGEPNADAIQLVFDALRVTRIDGGGGTDTCG